MPHTSNPYAHRINPDRTTDSICKECFATIGTAEAAEYLKALELAHACEPWRLHVVEIVSSKKSTSEEIPS